MRGAPGPVAALPLLLLVISLVAGCLGGGADLEAPPAADAVPARALIGYLSNLSQVLEGVSVQTAIVEQYRIAAPDGTLLDTWVLRPDIEGRVPLILEVTPYYAGGTPVFDLGVGDALTTGTGLAGVFLERGYAVGVSSVRGTGNSEGCFTQGGPSEARDTAAVIGALAAEPWSNGNVGLMGASYPGTTPQHVWLEAPPALKTIVPVAGISDFYKYNFANGVPIMVQGFGFNAYYWGLVGLLPSGFPLGHTLLDPLSVPGALAGEACTDQLGVQSAGAQATLSGDKSSYWQERDFARLHRDTWDRNPERASVFYIHGLQDWNVKPHHMEDWLAQVQDSGVPYKVWLGQWGHAWPDWREDWWNATIVAWFDQWLKGVETGILDAPAVQVQDDALRWRHEPRWPAPGLERLVFHPGADGALATQPATGEVTYHDRSGAAPGGTTAGEALWGPDRVVFESAPFQEELIVTGQPRFLVDATATGKRASLMLTLQEVRPDGDVRSFGFAVQSLNHAHDLSNGHDDIADQRIEVDLRFFPLDSRIEAGSAIRLVAASNLVDGPASLRNDDAGEEIEVPTFVPLSDGSNITLQLDEALLELPVQRAVVFEDPQPCWEERARCGDIA